MICIKENFARLVWLHIVIERLLIRIYPDPHKAVEEWCIAEQLECCLLQLVIIDWWAFVCVGKGQTVCEVKDRHA